MIIQSFTQMEINYYDYKYPILENGQITYRQGTFITMLAYC